MSGPSVMPPSPVLMELAEPSRASRSTTDSSMSASSSQVPPPYTPDLEDAPSFYLPPPHKAPEHFRDIRGPLTLHRVFLLLYLTAVPAGLYYLQNLLWPPERLRPPDTLWTLLGIIWLVPLPAAVMWIAGALWFRYNTAAMDAAPPVPQRVSWRIVSRGTNAECLTSTIRRIQSEMRRTPLFPYIIEVVTDGDVYTAPPDHDVFHVRVPKNFQPPNGAKYKARALHFAAVHSPVPDDVWVVHLDEESQPTSSGIKGVALMIARCEAEKAYNRIGQGCILYHRSWDTHPLLTLADMRRTGDDIGHFHLQHRLGYTLFGLHGSYVVARQSAERELGFDVGVRGSITEDAWWVLLAMEKGYRTVWVDGYMEEQSTQSVMDFLKQRRRWYVGLVKVGAYCPVNLRFRAVLMFNILSWIVVPIVLPLQIVYLALSVVFEKQIILAMRVLTSIVAAVAFGIYFVGLVINMREHGTPVWRGPLWIILITVLMPFFFLLEFAAIVMALFSPLSENAKGFHVVVKSGSAPADTDTATTTVDSD